MCFLHVISLTRRRMLFYLLNSLLYQITRFMCEGGNLFLTMITFFRFVFHSLLSFAIFLFIVPKSRLQTSERGISDPISASLTFSLTTVQPDPLSSSSVLPFS